MASMFTVPPKKRISVLDPGSGSGILSAALIERLAAFSGIDTVDITCYENDSNIIPLLRSNLEMIRNAVPFDLRFSVREDNYILSNAASFNHLELVRENYDLVIANPPYKRIPKDDPEAICMSSVCSGFPNKYSIFMSLSMSELNDNGQLVYIIPRSWTSGKYFRAFRSYIFDAGSMERIHIFASRGEVFRGESVLQETMIVKFSRNGSRDSVHITSTMDGYDYTKASSIDIPYNQVVQGDDRYVYIITTPDENDIVRKVNGFGRVLTDSGFRMRTGQVVDFRARDLISDESGKDAVPFFQSTHLSGGTVAFPKDVPGEYISDANPSLVQPNTDYLFVKRFTSKEEKRRLQPSIYLSDRFQNYKFIGTDNKINYITRIDGSMEEEDVYGLYVLFNSTLYDRYFRILNGSTQVNSTEINNIPAPPREVIDEMGKDLINAGDLSTESCDRILEGVLNGRTL